MTIQLLKKGFAILSVEPPAGFEGAPAWGRIAVTVE
jgi:hypothetical protein